MPDETIEEYPTSRYPMGRLAPSDVPIDPSENDAMGAGADDDEGGREDAQAPLIIGFHPCSFGLSFLLDSEVPTLRAEVSWGDYEREKNPEGGYHWRRHPRRTIVTGIPVKANGLMRRIALSADCSTNPPSVKIEGSNDVDLTLEGVVHEFAGYRAVSLFVVNRRTRGEVEDPAKDEQWVFQPLLRLTSDSERGAIFLSKEGSQEEGPGDIDGEVALANLLYRHAREFATGHGVAATWDPTDDGERAYAVGTEFMPSFEVPQLIPPPGRVKGAVFDMLKLADMNSPEQLKTALSPLVDGYESWVGLVDDGATKDATIQGDPQLKSAAEANIQMCRECAQRLRAGLKLLQTDPVARTAFRFANRVMADQRHHSLWAAKNRKTGQVQGSWREYVEPRNHSWRDFQLGFILLNLAGIVDESHDDRHTVDLLWFPTGGGKTEAYLGLAAFTLALRRLRGDRAGMEAGAGVSIIMRYTLRLLTVQQFQRAAALICACEVQRRQHPETWGHEPFRIGVWVGAGTTPNTYFDSQKALERLAENKKPREGSPVQLVSCPRCGAMLANDNGQPESGTYVADRGKQRTLIWCPNEACEFSSGAAAGDGLPVVVVDEEVYRTCPSFLVATVDKFARLPFKGQSRALFGMRTRYSAQYGHLTDAHGEKLEGRKVTDDAPAPRLLPPELIIQDELHLISGPLGTMVGLYETAVDFACRMRTVAPPGAPAKVIASTATIRRAAQQVTQLYARKLRIFPPSGVSSKDSFFAKELPIDDGDDASAGRLFVGVNAPGSSSKTLLVRVYSILLAAAQAELDTNPSASDPYATLVGYFNSMRSLGGAKRLVEDDVGQVRLKYLQRRRSYPRRWVSEPDELNSRLDSWKIPGLLKKLDVPFPKGSSPWPSDVLLATNMISVGVDIDRLGLMVVSGQPKTTAEYIQASSRVGRKHPGLVVTMYNWLSARDLSHYERFRSYHSALYKYVEAISVTPFSSRALDRALPGVFAAMNRLSTDSLASEPAAQQFDPSAPEARSVVQDVYDRAKKIAGSKEASLVRDRMMSHRDEWSHLSDDLLRYCWHDEGRRPPQNSRVLLRTAGTQEDGEWSTPGSLREVEPAAAFFLDEVDE